MNVVWLVLCDCTWCPPSCVKQYHQPHVGPGHSLLPLYPFTSPPSTLSFIFYFSLFLFLSRLINNVGFCGRLFMTCASCQRYIYVGPTVFREPRNFKPSRGIWPLPRNFVFPRNFTEFRINTEVPRQHPNAGSLHCRCNRDTIHAVPSDRYKVLLISATRFHIQFAYLLKFLLTGPL